MGYWDTHPLGGDAPLDALHSIEELLWTEDEYFDDGVRTTEEYQKRIKDKIHDIIHIDTKLHGFEFVIPFFIAKHHFQIEDAHLSQKAKDMIGDGGASGRGYDIKIANRKNKYNGFQSPHDYACQLRDEWDDLMAGKKSFDSLQRDVGLFEKIQEIDGNVNIN